MNIRLSEIEISFAEHVQFFNKIFLFKLDSFIRKCQKIVDCMYMILKLRLQGAERVIEFSYCNLP